MESRSKSGVVYFSMLSFGVGAMLIASLGSHAHLGLATSTGTSNYAALEEKNKALQNTSASNTSMNIVLVHGAWVDGSSWSKVISILKNYGHRLIAVQLPEHSLADDIATVKRAIELVGGPTVLVGHSYGGMVITNAAHSNPNVKGLVYVAAFAPDEGESIGDFVDIKRLPKDLLIEDGRGFAYINPKMFAGAFAQDVDSTEADIMAVIQKPFSTSIFAEKSGPPAWKQLPTWYQISENDHMIPPDLERKFSKQMNANTISLPSSHASLVSHPNAVAQLILNATIGSQ
jgi:pimeloyl-ACP methyl ester carboxylesterase